MKIERINKQLEQVLILLIAILTFVADEATARPKEISVKNVLKIRISGNGYSDETIIRFLDGATENFDPDYDAWKLISNNPDVPSIYTCLENGDKLSINAFPELLFDKYIPIFLKVNNSGFYDVEIERLAPFEEGLSLYIKDLNDSKLYEVGTGQNFQIEIQQALNGLTPSLEFFLGLPPFSETLEVSCTGFADGKMNFSKKGSSGFNFYLNKSAELISSGHSLNDSVLFEGLSSGQYLFKYVLTNTVSDSFEFTISEPQLVIAEFATKKSEIEVFEVVDFINLSINATEFSWDFGDGKPKSDLNSPAHYFEETGLFEVKLVSLNGICNDTASKKITVIDKRNVTGIGVQILNELTEIKYSRPFLEIIKGDTGKNLEISVFDLTGKKMLQQNVRESEFINLSHLPEGIYIVQANDGIQAKNFKFAW